MKKSGISPSCPKTTLSSKKPFCQGLRSQLVERNCLGSCRKPSTMFKSKLVHAVFLWWLNERELEGSLVQEQIQEILTKRRKKKHVPRSYFCGETKSWEASQRPNRSTHVYRTMYIFFAFISSKCSKQYCQYWLMCPAKLKHLKRHPNRSQCSCGATSSGMSANQ